MQFPPSDHVVWKLARLMIVCGVLMFMLKYNYLNGWSVSDIGTLVVTLFTLGGFDVFKTAVAPKPEIK